LASKLNPYINFKDNARQALEFYRSVFGGELNIMTFGDMNATQDPADKDRVMHGQLESPSGMTLMASDTPGYMQYSPFAGGSMSLSGSNGDDAELSGYFEKLSAGGSVQMPLEKAMWGDKFGMCTDKFGVPWLVNISAT